MTRRPDLGAQVGSRLFGPVMVLRSSALWWVGMAAERTAGSVWLGT